MVKTMISPSQARRKIANNILNAFLRSKGPSFTGSLYCFIGTTSTAAGFLASFPGFIAATSFLGAGALTAFLTMPAIRCLQAAKSLATVFCRFPATCLTLSPNAFDFLEISAAKSALCFSSAFASCCCLKRIAFCARSCWSACLTVARADF